MEGSLSFGSVCRLGVRHGGLVKEEVCDFNYITRDDFGGVLGDG